MNITRRVTSALIPLALILFSTASVRADGPATSPEKEAELIAVLTSEAPASEKAIACKNLAIYGTALILVTDCS